MVSEHGRLLVPQNASNWAQTEWKVIGDWPAFYTTAGAKARFRRTASAQALEGLLHPLFSIGHKRLLTR